MPNETHRASLRYNISDFFSSLLEHREPQPSFAGIILLIVAAIGMPWLASQKRNLATQVGSASLRADATESALCGYLPLIALAGTVGKPDLSRAVGRPDRGFGPRAAHREGRMGSHPHFPTLL
jgi:hypothetical protein